MKRFLYFAAIAAAFSLTSCSDDDNDGPIIDPVDPAEGVFIVNSGNFGAGNSSLSYLSTTTNTVANNLFRTANDMSLGDVAQSMTIANGLGWIVVNNSNVIFAIDTDTYKEKGRIDKGLTSPRNIYFINSTKAYVTQLYDNRIAIVDPASCSVTGYITVPGMDAATGSTENMVMKDGYAYCTCWSYQKKVIKIDTSTNAIVGSVEVGVQPKDIVFDNDGDLRVLTDGGWDGNPIGYEAPSIVTIDPDDMEIEKKLTMKLGDYVSNLIASADGRTLYWINANQVMKMDAEADALPTEPYVKGVAYLNALTIDPANGDLLVADALDYVQLGAVYRYHNATLTDTYTVGVIPNAFCWK